MRLRQELERFHRDEGGAILMLALVAAMIIILIANTLYDAGRAAHEKIEVQSAADVAAYSQAAIKARSMNMMAYSNVAKRSIWGIHSTYPAYLKSLHFWIRESIEVACAACRSGGNMCNECWLGRQERQRWIHNVCEAEEGFDCKADDPATAEHEPATWGNFRSMAGAEFMGLQWEGGGEGRNPEDEWPRVPDREFHAGTEDPSDPFKSLFRLYHAEDVRALDNYQRYLFGVTPWWAWTEQLLKSLRAGATVSGSWPMPAGGTPALANQIVEMIQDGFNQAAIRGGASPTFTDGMANNYSLYVDALPVYPGKPGAMNEAIRDSMSVNFSGFLSCARSYLTQVFQGGGNINACPNLDPFLVEHLLNAALFTLKSRGLVRGEYMNLLAVTLGVHVRALSASDGYGFGLDYTQRSFDHVLGDDRLAAEPWLLRRFRNAGMWQINTSNLVLAYAQRMGTFDAERDRKKYGFMQDYHGDSMEEVRRKLHFYKVEGLPGAATMQELTYTTSGYWGMARSEIYFADENSDRPDLWHPSWSARMRPVSLPGEFDQGQYTMNQIFHDITKSIAVGTVLGVTNLRDLATAVTDLMQNEKVTNAMGPSTIEGVAK